MKKMARRTTNEKKNKSENKEQIIRNPNLKHPSGLETNEEECITKNTRTMTTIRGLPPCVQLTPVRTTSPSDFYWYLPIRSQYANQTIQQSKYRV